MVKRLTKKQRERVFRDRVIRASTPINYWTRYLADVVQVARSSGGGVAGANSPRFITYWCGSNVDYTDISGSASTNPSASALPQVFDLANIANFFGTSGILSDHFLIRRATLQYEVKNQSNTDLVAVMYECTARQDYTIDPNVVNLLQSGFWRGGTPDGITRWELTPFQSITFTEWFIIKPLGEKIVKAGKTLFKSVSVGERYVNMAKYYYRNDLAGTYRNTAPDVYIPRGGKFILFKFTGTLADDLVGGASVGGVTFSYPKIFCTTRRRYEYQVIYPSPSQIREDVNHGFDDATVMGVSVVAAHEPASPTGIVTVANA